MTDKARSRAELAALDAAAPSPRWVRALAYLVVGGGLFSILCCAYVLYIIKPTVSNDPDFVAYIATNIIEFQPIEGYAMKGAINWPLLSLLKMKAAYYENPDVDGTLVLIEVGSDVLQGNERAEKHLEAMLREKNGISDALQLQPKVVPEVVLVQARERRFELSRALDPVTNFRYRIIEGTVTSRMGNPVFLGLRYKVDSKPSDSDADADRLPADVRKMLESIK